MYRNDGARTSDRSRLLSDNDRCSPCDLVWQSLWATSACGRYCCKKVFSGWRTKIPRAADAFYARRCEGPYRFIQNRSRTSVVALKSVAAAEKSKDQLSRDFQGCSIFDFCNNICQLQTCISFRPPAATSTFGSSLSQKLHYDGKPASRQASIKASASAGMTPMAVQYPLKLKDGCRVSACIAAALASSLRPSLARAAASRLRVTLKLGLDRTAQRPHSPLPRTARAGSDRWRPLGGRQRQAGRRG